MAVSVKHAFVSAIPDSGDTTIVQPSNWNDEHTILGLGTAAEADTADFAAAVHTHVIGDVTGLQTALDGKAASVHTHTASQVTDFDTEVSNNVDVAANTAARHAAVTVTDSAEIDFTLTGQDITASLKAGSIDETKLDASVNASLDLADSAVQPAAIANMLETSDIGVSVQGYSAVLAGTTASFTTTDETKLDGIEAGADVTDATNVAAAGAVMESDTSTALMSFVVDEDDMASDSATKVPTQQSVKAYVDGAEVKEDNIDPTPLGFYTTDGSGVRLWKFADRVLIGDAVTYNGGKNGTEMNSAQSEFAGSTMIRWLERDAQLNVVSTEGVTAIVGHVRTGRRSGYFDAARQRASIGISGVGVTDTGDYNQAAWAGYFEAWVKHDGTGTHNRGAYGMEITATDSRVGGVSDNPYKGIGTLALGIWLAAAALSAETGDAEGPSSAAIKIGKGRTTWYKGIVFNSDGIEGSDGSTTTSRGRAIEMALGHEIGWRNNNSAADTPSAGAHIRYTGIGTDGFTGMLFGNRTIKFIGNTSYADEKSLFEINAPSSGDPLNYLSLTVQTSGPALLGVAGSDTNIDFWAHGKGTGVLVAYKSDTTVNAVSNVFQLRHFVSSGTPAVGVGTGMDFVSPNGVGSNRIGMAVQMVATDVTNGSEDFDFVVRLMENGAAHAERFRVRSSGVIAINGTTVLGTRKTGWAAATGTATRTTFATGSVTLPQLAERVKALIDDLISHGAIGA